MLKVLSGGRCGRGRERNAFRRGRGRRQAPAAGRLSVVTFDAYGTLFDVFSVMRSARSCFPAAQPRSRSSGASSSSNTRSCAASWLGQRLSWRVTEDALVYVAEEHQAGPHGRGAAGACCETYLTLVRFPTSGGPRVVRAAACGWRSSSNGETKNAERRGKERGDHRFCSTYFVSAEKLQVQAVRGSTGSSPSG